MIDTVLASRLAAKNSDADLATTTSEESSSDSARASGSDVQTIDLTMKKTYYYLGILRQKLVFRAWRGERTVRSDAIDRATDRSATLRGATGLARWITHEGTWPG